MKSNRKEAARRKLLSIMPRSTLETLAEHERPWNLSRTDLIARSMERWDNEEIKAGIEKIVQQAC